jgi:hypothetical protein
MSTPVSVEPPPRAHLRTDSEQERDLQARLQRMIKLQYEEQQLYTIESEGKMPKRSSTELMGLNALDMEENGAEEEIDRFTTPFNSTAHPHPGAGLPPPSPSLLAASGVGRGTLYFSSTYQSGGGHGVSGEAPVNNNPAPPPPNPPEQIYAGGYGAVSDQRHDFHYGNPDYHDPYDAIDEEGHSGSRKSFCEKCCCLYRPLMNILSQEHLHRSFVYGSIDGMLTGSGIVSAFHALNVLTIYTIWEIRLAVVVFSAAACIADSFCMAIGHVWTSYVMSMGHAQDRARERNLLGTSRADAKAKLVDALLARGMLKIDAMSLADTLEGYPDLFIGALVGDSLLAGGDEPDDETDDSHTGVFNAAFKRPSYGQFTEERCEDTRNVDVVVKESQKEGFFMMVGFATFAVVPSLLWLILPEWFKPPTAPHTNEGQTITLPSIIFTISAMVMWCLGVWKSKFLDSNWAVFGIETVIVLFVCVLSSYGVGSLLFYALGDSVDGLTLTNAPALTS